MLIFDHTPTTFISQAVKGAVVGRARADRKQYYKSKTEV